MSDVADGWRDKRADGGVVTDIETGGIVCEGLSMPHSPRLHDGRLWLLNSGTGEFGFVDRDARRLEPVAFCPGYARGLAFAGGCAVVGLSLPRDNRTFQGLPLDAAFQARNAEPPLRSCGCRSRQWRHRRLGVVHELYEVVFLPGVRTPAAIGFKTDEILRVISIDDA